MIKTYKLCVIGEYGQRKTFGPMLTLQQAERYQADMTAGGMPCLIVNLASDYDASLKTKGRKVWQRFSLLTM